MYRGVLYFGTCSTQEYMNIQEHMTFCLVLIRDRTEVLLKKKLKIRMCLWLLSLRLGRGRELSTDILCQWNYLTNNTFYNKTSCLFAAFQLNLPHTSTFAVRYVLMISLITPTSGSFSGTCSTDRASRTTTSLIGTCSNLYVPSYLCY